jgi:hypothetical protein
MAHNPISTNKSILPSKSNIQHFFEPWLNLFRAQMMRETISTDTEMFNAKVVLAEVWRAEVMWLRSSRGTSLL